MRQRSSKAVLDLDRRGLMLAVISGTVSLRTLARESASNDIVLLRDLYNKDLSFSDRALSSEGKRLSVTGYMAPPLKAESRFFVLTKRPMAVCPFCESDADWPDDILAVYTKRIVKVLPYNAKMTVNGVLQLGGVKDAENGFYSKVRLTEATYRRGA